MADNLTPEGAFKYGFAGMSHESRVTSDGSSMENAGMSRSGNENPLEFRGFSFVRMLRIKTAADRAPSESDCHY